MREIPLQELLREHPVFADFTSPTLDLLVGCARPESFHEGDRLIQEGEPADRFYLLREGRVAIEIRSPQRAPLIVETLERGDVLGWSWLVAPYRWTADARAVSAVRAIRFDGACLRAKCADNHALGYELFLHILPVMARRMTAQRLQLLDLYGQQSPA